MHVNLPCRPLRSQFHTQFGRYGLGWYLLPVDKYGICLGVEHSYSLGEISPFFTKTKEEIKRTKRKQEK